MDMLLIALLLFTFVALFGGIMAAEVVQGRRANWSHTRAHALFALLGAALLIAAYLKGDMRLLPSILLVIVIASAGFYLARLHATDQPQPRGLLVAHGGLAVACYVLLGYLAFSNGSSLFDRLGGKAAIASVVDDFVGNVVADNRINRYFAKSNAERVKTQLVDFVCQGSGGPCVYTGKDMRAAHEGMRISSAEFDALAEDLSKSLQKHNVPEKEHAELLTLLGSMKNDVIER